MRKTVTKVLEDSYIGKITETWKESKIELDGRLLDAGGRLVSPKHRYATAKFEAELPQKEAVVFAALRQLIPAKQTVQVKEKCREPDAENPLREGLRRLEASGAAVNISWSNRTQRSYLTVFKSQIAPLLLPYVRGEKEFLPPDLDALQEKLQAKKAQNLRSRCDGITLSTNVRVDLAAADKIYRYLRSAYPDLMLPELDLEPESRRGLSARAEQCKALPEPVRQAFFRAIEQEINADPAIAAGACLMVSGGLRTAEAAAVTPSSVNCAEVYVAFSAHGMVRTPCLKNDNAYRVAILPRWGVEILERCFAALEAVHPHWYKDESCALCDPAELSAWVIKTLRRCGCSTDYLESAKAEYERWVTRDRSGRPIETADAYVLRRDWATRARCICGLTALEIDMLMGHENPTPYAARPDFTLSNVCFDLSAKLGRYIYSTTLTDHPRYSPQVVHHGDDLSLVAYPVQRIVNGGSTPLVLRISVESAEPGESVAIEHADGGEIRNIRVHHMAWDREKMMDKTIQMEQGEFDYEK